MEVAAVSAAVPLQSLEVRSPEDFDCAFEAAASAGVTAIIVFSSPMVFLHRTRIAELAAMHGLPAISPFREFAEAGGLMAYGQNLSDLFRRCGRQVGRILPGAKPADLAVERPMKFELIINLKTAKVLGLTIPPLLLFQADDWKLDRRSCSLTTI